jgi:hypothetical protein
VELDLLELVGERRHERADLDERAFVFFFLREVEKRARVVETGLELGELLELGLEPRLLLREGARAAVIAPEAVLIRKLGQLADAALLDGEVKETP